MRPYSELADIALLLKDAEKIKIFLQKSALETIDEFSKKGELWLAENSKQSFSEIKQYIVGKTLEVLQGCFSFTENELNKLTDISTTQDQFRTYKELRRLVSIENDYKTLVGNFNDLNKTVMLQTSKLDSVIEKLTVLQQRKHKCKRSDTIKTLRKETMMEFQAASNYMSALAANVDDLSKTQMKLTNQEKENDEMKVVNTKIEVVEQEHAILRNRLEDISKYHDSFERKQEICINDMMNCMKKVENTEIKQEQCMHNINYCTRKLADSDKIADRVAIIQVEVDNIKDELSKTSRQVNYHESDIKRINKKQECSNEIIQHSSLNYIEEDSSPSLENCLNVSTYSISV